ncbi:hypothetical protein BDF20DRAFT_622489 [Mycotypha africana]|uniref:uncharacterized protein n=1 Tax=Mycotypha africana TaxID=64632 RepID=UPI002300C84A|nr:uncharacterized protein BDF20DRAFT_622489 [Mycotypha africana]KAI8975644.1 hypothetical protein BDF20DRAFT_622489 [Mycotypha africana]
MNLEETVNTQQTTSLSLKQIYAFTTNSIILLAKILHLNITAADVIYANYQFHFLLNFFFLFCSLSICNFFQTTI